MTTPADCHKVAETDRKRIQCCGPWVTEPCDEQAAWCKHIISDHPHGRSVSFAYYCDRHFVQKAGWQILARRRDDLEAR